MIALAPTALLLMIGGVLGCLGAVSVGDCMPRRWNDLARALVTATLGAGVLAFLFGCLLLLVALLAH